MAYLYVDIETCPLDRDGYLTRGEQDRKKLLNPIDSKIILIGVKGEEREATIIRHGEEGKMLSEFWRAVESFTKQGQNNRIVGFNIKDFDMPFLVTRSFINNVPIVPFTLREIIDLREKLSAFKYGNVRGKLKEYAQVMGIRTISGVDGEKIAELCWQGEWEKLEEYLEKDLEITEAIHRRTIQLRINEIERW